MRLVTFSAGDAPRPGVAAGDRIFDLGYPDMPALLEDLDRAREKARRPAGRSVPRSSARIHAPILKPPKFILIGLNYRDHAIESGDRKSTRLNSSHIQKSRMPSSA